MVEASHFFSETSATEQRQQRHRERQLERYQSISQEKKDERNEQRHQCRQSISQEKKDERNEQRRQRRQTMSQEEKAAEIGIPVILLRNLNPALGLCKGTRLQV